MRRWCAPSALLETASNAVGRIKLVNLPEADLRRGDDGLFLVEERPGRRWTTKVRVNAGTSSKRSNVNVVDAMVNLDFSLSCQFELQIKMLQTADTNAQRAPIN